MTSAPLTAPIDKAALTLIGLLSTAIAIFVGGHWSCQNNERCWLANRPHVQDFTWQNQTLGAKDRAFIVTFDRPMNRQAVEQALQISPLLPGKISWVGRKLAYTLEQPIPYGEEYTLKLSKATEYSAGPNRDHLPMKPFVGQFRSRDRAFAYIGTQGIEQGRIIYYNLTHQRKTILTPPDLTVVDFKFYDQAPGTDSVQERLLFSAADRSLGFDGLRQLQLYSTPVLETVPEQALPEPLLILSNEGFQNNQFDVSADGKTIVIQRVNRSNPADFDLWMLRGQEPPQRLKVPGGDFKIAPDSQSLAVARGEGIGILPLQAEAKPIDFLPKFGQLLSFSPDGTAAAMVNFNMDNAKKRYQRSLFYVNNQGLQRELLSTEGSVLNCQFNGTNQLLYCLLTNLLPGELYQEQPYFAQINLKTGKVIPLAVLPEYQDIKVSLSPDSLALLFDQVVTDPRPDSQNSLSTDSGANVVGGKLWLLILPPINNPQAQAELKALPLEGIRPRWAP
ncbi:hypothetical protein [Synechocystis sp. LKSZ1]|uniref:hypothetical protein n=1 Tax=Synechocystis sp. LKSZ1 TaxID=3144951 RepID=UPI00336BB775